MEFRLLGPVEVRSDGRELALGGPKQRALLAMLLLDANKTVSRDRLIDGLWGERPPPTAAHTLDSYVSRLRKALSGGRLSRNPPGYVLRVEPDELDLDLFERLFRDGREAQARGDSNEAGATLRSALDLWRGAALADVLYEPFAATESPRLEERRLMALEQRIDADLALGRDDELVPELEALVRDHPFRERLLYQLMLGLYRSGRQAEALGALRAAKRRFAEELGLEPGPQLRDLERLILEQDPQLIASSPPKRVQSSRLRRLAVVVAGGAVVVSIVAGILLERRDMTRSNIAGGASDELAAVSARSSRPVAGLSLQGAPGAIAATGRSLWVADPDSALVTRVSLASNSVVDRIPVVGQPAEIAVGGGSVWVANTVGGVLVRIDPRTGTITQTIPLGGNIAAIASGMGAIWVAEAGGDQSLIRIDWQTGTPTRTVSLPVRPSALAVGFGGIWVASHDAGSVTEIDPGTAAVLATVHVGQGPAAIAIGGKSVWIANNLDGTVMQIDPDTPRIVATIPVGSGPVALASSERSLWVANKWSNSVSRIDASRAAVVGTVQTGGPPTSLAVVADRIWIGMRPSGDQHRGGTLTLLGFRPSIDPAFNQENYPPPQFTTLTADTLVTFEHTAGPDGLNLVPDLALSLPAPTDGGTTYLFRLRPGIRYSDGRPLRASDVRRGFERLFHVGSPAAGSYTGVIGGTRCARQARRCDLSKGIVVDDAARTVVFHLAAPDPTFLSKLTLGYAVPVPPGTPLHEAGSRPIPGTGPYRIVRSTSRETRFVRNPYFHEWSHSAQPDGYPDTILWRYDLSPAAQARAVQQGRADWLFETIPSKNRTEIELHEPGQLHVNPVMGTEFMQIDTRAPPFNDVRVRQALNYAVDRDQVVRLYGGPLLATPTCQVLPPGLPGYRRYCPYTAHPRLGGEWTAPDLSRARRLVADSGTSGARLTVWAESAGFHNSLPRYVAGVLRRLGYRAQVRPLPDGPSPFAQAKAQIRPATWFGGELGPAEFFQDWFACDGAEGRRWFCDPQLDRLMRGAVSVAATDARRAAADWADVDRKAVDAGGWVPLVTPREVDFVSSRVRNYQFNPLWGLLADQVWLR